MHDVAFRFGNFTIYWYGILVALGFLAALWTASRRAPISGIASERVADLGPWLILGAVVGARVFFVVSYWREEFAGHPFYEVFMIRRGGLVFYGGFIGAAVAHIIFCRLKRIPLWKMADVIAPSIALGYFFGRLGCLMTGCCFGKECDLPWAIRFPAGHESYPHSVHPTQLYEAFLGLILYGILAWLYRRKRFDGQVFAIYLVASGLIRFSVEFFRGDYPVHYLGGWATPAQPIAAAIFIAGIGLWYALQRRQRPASARESNAPQ
jgi:phosphatidylglycerol:prolipoprotein diacylglycerol transferase